MSNKGKNFVRFEVNWPNRFKVKPLPFQRGDKVKTPNGIGFIEAVGRSGLHSNLYRVGRKQYWYGGQLKLLYRPVIRIVNANSQAAKA
jgi:hypothetical protein